MTMQKENSKWRKHLNLKKKTPQPIEQLYTI